MVDEGLVSDRRLSELFEETIAFERFQELTCPRVMAASH